MKNELFEVNKQEGYDTYYHILQSIKMSKIEVKNKPEDIELSVDCPKHNAKLTVYGCVKRYSGTVLTNKFHKHSIFIDDNCKACEIGEKVRKDNEQIVHEIQTKPMSMVRK